MAVRKSITLQLGLSGDTYFNPSMNLTLDEAMSGDDSLGVPQSIATGSWQAITISPCASADWMFLINTDATNYVQLAADAGGTAIFGKLTPGRGTLIPVDPSATIYAQANTGACKLKKLIIEP